MVRARKVVAWLLIAGSLAVAKDKAPLKFLAPGDVDVIALLPPPPLADSQEQQAELAQVLAVQASRTPADIERAKAEDKLTVFAFADIIGKDFSADQCPLAKAFFADIESDAKAFGRIGKEHWNRQRPPYVNNAIQPVVTLEQEGSYPSGHAARATVYALVLADMFPDHRDALLQRAAQIGWDRVIGGVHYPSDVMAGRVLGQAIAAKMLNNPEFVKDEMPVKAELQHLAQASAAGPNLAAAAR